ncbi:hypothetical protein CWC31_16230 [Pseudoalteromonas ruthenica]|uniref:hypothetical protein n=1 Tax=Pseudoalteromonas ruthenica TaxID=151081 RepID=UPI00110952F3|nr:hypothetical protein [Pseudoalteromonas ruthenica]TLX49486.1 hypothetical protein CWC31_16230 [Pseudoalteromonas ruthenica]
MRIYVAIIVLAFLTPCASADTHWQLNFESYASDERQQQLQAWVNTAVDNTHNRLGALHYKHVDVSISQPVFTTEAVPWGEIKRGPPVQVVLEIGRFADIKRIRKDWTIYHELAHLYMPYLPAEDRWLSEGFATLMQNYTMLHAGIYNRGQFEHRLQAGLARGKADTRIQQGPLSEVSATMWQRQAYQRVYWSGVAYFIEAENELARHKLRLSDIIVRYNHCCFRPRSSAKEFISALDGIAKTPVFSNLYSRYRLRHDFPTIKQAHITRLTISEVKLGAATGQ